MMIIGLMNTRIYYNHNILIKMKVTQFSRLRATRQVNAKWKQERSKKCRCIYHLPKVWIIESSSTFFAAVVVATIRKQ